MWKSKPANTQKDGPSLSLDNDSQQGYTVLLSLPMKGQPCPKPCLDGMQTHISVVEAESTRENTDSESNRSLTDRDLPALQSYSSSSTEDSQALRGKFLLSENNDTESSKPCATPKASYNFLSKSRYTILLKTWTGCRAKNHLILLQVPTTAREHRAYNLITLRIILRPQSCRLPPALCLDTELLYILHQRPRRRVAGFPLANALSRHVKFVGLGNGASSIYWAMT